MADNSKDKNKWSDFIVTSIGACLAAPEEKKSNPCIVVAYTVGGEREASFITLELPSKNKLYTRDDFLAAIKAAEGVKNVTYVTSLGAEKDIYLCRDNKGRITDVVARNYENNAFAEGFAEVYASKLRFSIDGNQRFAPLKPKCKVTLAVSATTESLYEENTYEYAVINAYNACLLGKLFEREELQLETRDKKPIRFEVRTSGSRFLDESVMYIFPISRSVDGVVDYYETEEFNYIDGEDTFTKKYKILYTNRLMDYNLMRL